MNPVLHLFAPVALLLPGVASVELVRDAPFRADAAAAPSVSARMVSDADTPRQFREVSADDFSPVERSFQAPVQRQVSIEQRFTIRISPRATPMPTMLDGLPRNGVAPRFAERRMGRCLPVAGIAGVQYRDANRLILYMRDRRIVSATLEKTCNARDFYSGFYVARNSDGMLCTDRDEILSRSGVNCELSSLRQLVEQAD